MTLKKYDKVRMLVNKIEMLQSKQEKNQFSDGTISDECMDRNQNFLKRVY